MGVLSHNDVSEHLIRASEPSHSLLTGLIRLPGLWGILLLASAVRFLGSTKAGIWGDEGSRLLLSSFP